MLDTRRWPQLAAIIKYDETPYVISPPRLLEEQCALGDRALSGQALYAIRLDMALAGLMAELGDDFFIRDIFPSRLTAAVDILAAAAVFLRMPLPGEEKQEERVRYLREEVEKVLQQWIQFAASSSAQTFLIAAEEPAELT